MIRHITNGIGVIKIGLNESGSYFEFNNLQSIVWLGGGYGTTANYIRQLPYSEEYRKGIFNHVNHVTNENYINRPTEAINAIQPLFELLENGTYEITYSDSENRQFFLVEDDNSICSWNLYISKTSEYPDEHTAIIAYKKFRKTNAKSNESFCPSIVDFSTDGFHVGSAANLIATQPFDAIDEERVKFYENEIKTGKRPFAITIEKYCEIIDDVSDNSIASETFVLDGHHKLLAYQKLNIYPPILNIKSICSKEELFFDWEKLKLSLFQWEYEHLTKHEITMDIIKDDDVFKEKQNWLTKTMAYINKNRR